VETHREVKARRHTFGIYKQTERQAIRQTWKLYDGTQVNRMKDRQSDRHDT